MKAEGDLYDINNADKCSLNEKNDLDYPAFVQQVRSFIAEKNLDQYGDVIVRGATLAEYGDDALDMAEVTDEERTVLLYERDHRWSHPWAMYFLAILNSISAAVQGMDESVINGALLFFPKQFGIGNANSEYDSWIQGIIASVPYFACAIPGCWLTPILNKYLGRRGTIFVTAFISGASCIWQAVTNSWQHLLVARLVMGLGIGPKSATTPIYTAECAPRRIRGALVMQWQVWTAFGFVLGYLADIGFYYVPNRPSIDGLNWRLMLGVACIPAIVVMAQVFFCPESPRWLMKRNNYIGALHSFLRLRTSSIQAARDLYRAHTLLEREKQEEHVLAHESILKTIFTRRNRRAFVATTILMLGQPFCGVNAIAFFSGTILSEAGLSDIAALLGSFGYGFLCFASSIPAWFTMDTFGRRSLLLLTIPFLIAFLLLSGFAFYISEVHQDTRVGVVLLGIYLFACFYGPGMGPVPFTYTSEAFPIAIREIGMASGTAVLWFFNGLLAVIWFRMRLAFTTTGAFGFYAGLCALLWILIFFLVPETKGRTLEELDDVFGEPSMTFATRQVRKAARLYRGRRQRETSVLA